MFWKTHIPVRTQKWPPRLIFAGACHSIVINYIFAGFFSSYFESIDETSLSIAHGEIKTDFTT